MGWIPWNLPVSQRISSNSQGVGFPNFSHFPSKSSLFSTKIKMCSTKHHMFFSQRFIIFLQFPIQKNTPYIIYIYMFPIFQRKLYFFPLNPILFLRAVPRPGEATLEDLLMEVKAMIPELRLPCLKSGEAWLGKDDGKINGNRWVTIT